MIRQKFLGTSETKTRPDGFGLDVTVTAPLPANPSDLIPSGTPKQEGQAAVTFPKQLYDGATTGQIREVIPPGVIGSEESVDKQLPAPQYVDTVQMYVGETNDPKLHGPVAALRSADRIPIAFNDYAVFTPRRAPMPRAAQDELYLRGYGSNSADPRMTSDDSFTMLIPKDAPDRCDLFDGNRNGVLNDAPPAPRVYLKRNT